MDGWIKANVVYTYSGIFLNFKMEGYPVICSNIQSSRKYRSPESWFFTGGGEGCSPKDIWQGHIFIASYATMGRDQDPRKKKILQFTRYPPQQRITQCQISIRLWETLIKTYETQIRCYLGPGRKGETEYKVAWERLGKIKMLKFF